MVQRILNILTCLLIGFQWIGAQPLLHIEGLLHVQNGALLHVQGDLLGVDGSSEQGRIELKGELLLEGDWTNNTASGLLEAENTGKAIFTGSQGTQSIGGTHATQFSELQIDKLGATGAVRLDAPASASKALDLTDDVLDLRGYDFQLLNPAPAALIRTDGIAPPFEPTAEGGYLLSTGGDLLRKMSPDFNGQAYLFPLAAGTRFRPLEITMAQETEVMAAVRFLSQSPPSPTALSPGLVSVNPSWYHQVAFDPGIAPGDALRIYFDLPTDNICNVSQVTAAHREAGYWTALSPTISQNGSPFLSQAEVVLDSAFLGEEIALAGLQIAEGLPSCVFPPDRLVLNAQPLDDRIELAWVTDEEGPNDLFFLEKSTDGLNFASTRTIAASGALSPQAYREEDLDVIQNQRYFYRVTQRDQNGGTRFSNVVEVVLLSDENAFLGDFFPNPNPGSAQFWLSLATPAELQMQLFNALGQELKSYAWNLEAGYQVLDFNFVDLAKGAYFAVVIINGKRSFRRMVVE